MANVINTPWKIWAIFELLSHHILGPAVKHHSVHSYSKERDTCSCGLQMIWLAENQHLMSVDCILYTLHLLKSFFPSHWIYFHSTRGRHNGTITVSVLLGCMGGAACHSDGCELSSAISVFTQHSSSTSEVQLYPVIEYRCVRDHSKYKSTLLW